MDNNSLKIVLAPQDDVEAFPAEVQRILGVVGHPEALITDESSVADFMIFLEMKDPEIAKHNQDIQEGMDELMGRPVDPDERLGNLARELHGRSQANTAH